MDTYTVEILEPKAEKLLDDLAELKLIKIRKNDLQQRKPRTFGSMQGLIVHIAADFDAPLADFEDYM